MRYEYATVDPDKTESAKATLIAQASRAGNDIVGFHVFTTSSYPKLQIHDATRGIEHTIIWGFTTQRELDAAASGS